MYNKNKLINDLRNCAPAQRIRTSKLTNQWKSTITCAYPQFNRLPCSRTGNSRVIL